MPIESEAPVSIRESLESAADQVEKAEVAPVIEKSEVSSQQSQDSVTSPDATDPVVDENPSTEGSVATVEDDSTKSITDVIGDVIDEKKGPEAKPPLESETERLTPKEEVSKGPEKKIEPAPASWKGDAKKLWSELPDEVRQEVSRREVQTQQVLTETANDRKRVAEINQVLTPHRDLINASYGGNPMKAINSLLGIDRALTSGNPGTKAEVVAKIIQTYAIDLPTLDSLLAGQPLPAEMQQQSDVQALVNQQIAPLMSYVQQQQQKEQQAVQQQTDKVNTDITSMAADAENYPHFDDIRHDMADIIEMSANRGIDVSLQEAYDKAIRLNGYQTPRTESKEDKTKAALQAHQEAQKAKGAAVSVSGNPTSVGSPLPKNTDIRSLISNAMDDGGRRV